MKIKVAKYSNAIQFQVTSELTFGEVRRAAKFTPKALVLMSTGDNPQELFRLSEGTSTALSNRGLTIPNKGTASSKVNIVMLSSYPTLEESKFEVATVKDFLVQLETQIKTALEALDAQLQGVEVINEEAGE